MKQLRRLLATVVIALCITTIQAQPTLDLAAYIDDATAAQLGSANTVALRDKISKIITRNGMADAPGFFVVTPTLSLTDDGEVDTGMTKVRVMRADLTLSVRNSLDNTVFGSQTIQLQSNGRNDEQCIRGLINKLNVGDARFAKMIQDVQGSISEYYARMMPRLLAKINSLVEREQYADAMAAMAMIPETVDEYQSIADLQVQVYNKFLRNEVIAAVRNAELCVNQGDIDGAMAQLKACNPLSPNYNEIVAFLRRLNAEAAAVEAAANEQELRKLDAKAQTERMHKEASAEAKELKSERAESSKTKGKSLGHWLFGL